MRSDIATGENGLCESGEGLMLEYPFILQKAPTGKATTFAIDLLAAACSDDLHGTDYFDALLVQYMMRAKA